MSAMRLPGHGKAVRLLPPNRWFRSHGPDGATGITLNFFRGTNRTNGKCCPTARKSASDPSTQNPSTRGNTYLAAVRCRDPYRPKTCPPSSLLSGTAVTGIVCVPTWIVTSDL